MNNRLVCTLTLLVLAACGGSDPIMDGSVAGDGGVMTDAIAETDGSVPTTCIIDTECNDGNPCTRDRCMYENELRIRSVCFNDDTPGACAEYRLVAGSIPLGCGLDAAGAVYCWDSGSDETFWPRTPVAGIPPLTQLAITEGGVNVSVWDGDGNYRVTGYFGSWACGLDETGSVWCWEPASDACATLTVPIHVQGISDIREVEVAHNGDGHLLVYMLDATGHLHYTTVDFGCNLLPIATEIALTDPTLTLREIDLWAGQNRGSLVYYDGFAITEDGRLAGFSTFGVYEDSMSTTTLPPFAHVEVGDWSLFSPIHVFVALSDDGTFWRQSAWALAVDSTSAVFERIEHAGFTTCGLRNDGTLGCFGGSNPSLVPYEGLHIYETPEESTVEIDGVVDPSDFSVVSGQLCVADEGRIRCWSIAEGFAEYPMPWNL